MNKRLRLTLALFVLLWGQIKAQVNPPCPNPPPPGAENCQNACVYCDFDGYMGINNGTPSGGNTVCGQIAIHNDQWFGFTAGTSSITINVITSNCANGDGLQSAFFDDCSDPDAIVCNPGSPGGAGQPLTLTYDGFTPGEIYFLMIDGWSGDICDFEIDIVDGSITPAPPDNAPAPSGPTMVCPGATAVYTIPDVANAGYYHWTSPPGSHINGGSNNQNIDAPEGTTVTITFGNSGGNVCVQALNSCNPASPQACLPVTNQPIPPTIRPPLTICYEDAPFIWDEDPFTILTAPGVYTLTSSPYDSYLGCDSTVKQTITIKQITPTNLGTKYTCAGTCFVFAGDNYCDAGNYNVTLESAQHCDSLINFALVVLDPQANIPPPPNSIDCNSSGVVLQSTGSTPLGQATYAWTNSSWTTLAGTPTYNATLTGTYHLIVTSQAGGVQCKDTASVVVTGNTVAPGATATGGNINCISPTVTLMGNSTTSGVNYTWTGPGITPANQFLQNPTVNTPGVYVLTVKNPVNGCTSTATVTVQGDITPPSAGATGGTITCTQTSITIDGSTNVATPTWTWVGPGINATNQHVEDPNVSVDGTYTVTVTNTVNGCTNTATVAVAINNTIPTVTAGPDQTLTCTTPNVTLQGAGNAGGQTISFSWVGPSPFTSNVAQPSVNVGGQYILTVLNTQNGCLQKDTVDIATNQTLPTANAGSDSTITCAEPSVTLIGNASSSGANFTATWTGPGINPGNANQYNPVVDQDGTYNLLITNTTNGCTATDQVDVLINTSLPTANAGPDQFLSCSNPGGVTLSGSGSPATVTYHWSGLGIGANNEFDQNPVVTQPDLYTVEVTNPVNGCTSTDQVVVTQDANVPTAAGGPDQTLNCSVSVVNFDGSASTTGPTITYTWSGPGISGANINAQSPTGLTQPGTYQLTVTNTSNNCINTDIVVIQIDTIHPNANAGTDRILNCFNNAIDTLDASASSLGSIYSLTWTGNGIAPADQHVVNPVINQQPGTYTLVVTNTDNTCTASDVVVVTSDLTAPTADAGADKTIDCVVTSTTIGGASSSGATFSYLWTGPGINATNETQATPTVSLPGTYDIVVTNNVNGCTASNDVVVNTNAVYPTALAGNDGLLTCANPSAVLDGSGSDNGAGFQVTWSGPGINAGNQNQVSPTVTVPGTYVVAIFNTSNSCERTDTVVVDENKATPAADAGADKKLDCQDIIITLDGSLSDVGATITYLWTGPGINASNMNDQTPSVNQPGAYTLQVMDTDNGCFTTDNITVTQDTVHPNANAGADLLITCAQPTPSIDGSGSSTGNTIGYVWQGPGINSGNFNQPSPVIDIKGTYILTVTNSQNHCSDVDQVVVNEDTNPPLIAAGPDRTLTCANPTAQLDASGSASGANISYSWTGPGIQSGGATTTPTVNLSGVYLLTVTDANNGCTSEEAVNVNEDFIKPTVSAGADLTLTCANATSGVTLSSAGSSTGANYTYLWSGLGITPANQNQPNPTVLVAGAYTLVITNSANGCSDSDAVVVNADQNLPTADAGNDQVITCSTPFVELDGSNSSSPTGTLIYFWTGPGINSGNATSDKPTVSVDGTYLLTVENTLTGCKANDQVAVTLDNQPAVVNATSDQITCQDPVSTVAVTSSLPGSTYLWSGPDVNPGNQNDPSFQVNVAGLYAVTVTAPNGCTTTTSTIVTEDANVPQGAAEGSVLNCTNGGTTIISGEVISPAGSTFTWTGPGISTPLTTSTITVTQPGTYIFTISAPNGCKRPLPVDVTEDYVQPDVIAVANETIDCNTSQVTISGEGSSVGPNFTYTWSTTDGHFVSGTNSLHPLVDRAGQYQLLISNNLNGCRDSVEVQVQVDPEVPRGFDLAVKNIKCFGETNGSITVNGVAGGTPPFIFFLSGNTGSANNQYTGLGAGQYQLLLEDANGCKLDTTISISEPGQLVVELGPDVEVNLGETATVTAQIQSSSGVQSVVWNYAPGCDTTTVFCETFEYLPLNSYRHAITVVDSNGCSARDELDVIVKKKHEIYVPNIFNPNSDVNYFLGVFTGIDVAKIKKFNVHDRWGDQVFHLDEYIPTPGAAPDAAHSWDGNVRGDKGQVGVYVWYCEVEFIDGTTKLFKGDVTLLR